LHQFAANPARNAFLMRSEEMTNKALHLADLSCLKSVRKIIIKHRKINAVVINSALSGIAIIVFMGYANNCRNIFE